MLGAAGRRWSSGNRARRIFCGKDSIKLKTRDDICKKAGSVVSKLGIDKNIISQYNIKNDDRNLRCLIRLRSKV